jgi:RNA polymerase sigma-70 factor (ECF subfamily)
MDKDVELINMILAGDRAAASLLVERYCRLVFHILNQDFRIFGEDAEEVCQCVFLRLWSNNCRALRHWRGNKFDAYLRRIVRSAALDFITGRTRTELPERQEPSVLPPDNPDMQDIIHAALKQLSPRQRQLIELKHIEDLSYREIADRLDITINNVGVALLRAESRLRQILSNNYADLFGNLVHGKKPESCYRRVPVNCESRTTALVT